MSLKVTQLIAPVFITPNTPFVVQAEIKGNTQFPVRASFYTELGDYVGEKIISRSGVFTQELCLEDFPLHKRKLSILMNVHDRSENTDLKERFTLHLKRG